MSQGLSVASHTVAKASSTYVCRRLLPTTNNLPIIAAFFAVLYRDTKQIHLHFKFILERNVQLPNRVNIAFRNAQDFVFAGNFDLYASPPDTNRNNLMHTQTVVLNGEDYHGFSSKPNVVVTFSCEGKSSSFPIRI